MKFIIIVLVVVIAIFVPYLPVLLYEQHPFSENDIATWSSNLNIVVTGANVGLGFATVEHLLRAGTANLVVMACRDTTKCDLARDQLLSQHSTISANNTKLLTVALDLSQRDSIEKGAHAIQQILNDTTNQTKPLHVLINNAGVAGAWKSRSFIDDVEAHILVNHIGHALLTHFLWPNLLAGTARIVHVSSVAALIPVDVNAGWYPKDYHREWWNPHALDAIAYYARSKIANLCFASELHQRYAPQMSSVASHPGYTRTHMMLSGFNFAPNFVKQFLHVNRIMSMSPSDGALTQLYGALHPLVRSGTWVGPTLGLVGKPVVIGNLNDTMSWHDWLFSRETSSELWNKTLMALKVSEFGALTSQEES